VGWTNHWEKTLTGFECLPCSSIVCPYAVWFSDYEFRASVLSGEVYQAPRGF
jgi:hypothetical protein